MLVTGTIVMAIRHKTLPILWLPVSPRVNFDRRRDKIIEAVSGVAIKLIVGGVNLKNSRTLL